VARRALVTGASRGIGAAVARRLASEGYELVLTARHEEGLLAIANELGRQAVRVSSVAGDLSVDEDLERVASVALEQGSSLQVLVLSAGMAVAGELASYPLRHLDRLYRVNVRAPFVLTQRLLPALRSGAAADPGRGARIVAIASMSGVVSEPLLGPYGVTKAALISLCEAITVEEATHGVLATAISPGFVDTDMGAWAADHIDPAAMVRAEDVAEMVVAVTHLSPHAVVPNLVLARPGENLWRA
jgi:3-oxoacyl-[acyl-carrier protein] reductase